MEYFERALEIDQAVYGNKHPKVAIDFNNLSRAFQDMGDAKKAVEYLEKALVKEEKSLMPIPDFYDFDNIDEVLERNRNRIRNDIRLMVRQQSETIIKTIDHD